MSSGDDKCVRCERTEDEVPILKAKFKGEAFAICSACLPVLIHKPHELQARLAGAESIEPTSHSHH